MCAANTRDFGDVEQAGRCQQFVIGTRTDGDNSSNSGHLRGYHSHQQGRHESVTPAGHIATDGLDWPHSLADSNAWFDLHGPWPRQLFVGDTTYVPCGMFHGPQEILSNADGSCIDLRT